MRNKKVKIVLDGYYGRANFGDDIMLLNLCRYLNGQCEISVIVRNSRFVQFLESFNNVRIFEFPFKKNFINKFLFYFKTYRNNVYWIWGGGTCFSNEDGVVNFKKLLIARLLGLRVIFLGVGIGSELSRVNVLKMKIISALTDKIYARDANSFVNFKKYFSAKKLFLTEDLAYLSMITPRKQAHSGSIITVSLRKLDNYIEPMQNEKIIDELLAFVNDLLKDGKYKTLNILPLDSTYDYDVCKKFAERSNGILKDVISVDEKINVINESDMYICFRLHGVFAALAANVKTIGIVYAPKMKYFMDSVGYSIYLDLNDITRCSLQEKLKETEQFDMPDISYDLLQRQAVKNLDFILN